MAVTNHERVGQALKLLAQGLAPFVERECRAKHGDGWVTMVARTDDPSRKMSPTDVQFLLKAIWDEWRAGFDRVLGQSERTLVSELRDTRNRWAHQEVFSSDDVYRALDSAHRLLAAVSAPEEASMADKLKQDLLRQRFAEASRQQTRKVAAAPVESQPQAGLRPWREIVTPHPDVASGRYQLAEFAADLHQVWRGEAADEYGDRTEFFRRTFLTDGLTRLLVGATERLAGIGGDPVVELQTNFGGGKTHSLIALYHLAAGGAVGELPGVDEALGELGMDTLVPAHRAVLVGQMVSPGKPQVKPDGTEVRTLWGELAWQLGGADAFALVAKDDAEGTNPGQVLVDLLRRFSPCLILIDEWVAYARQLYGRDGLAAGSFDAQFTFAQALTEAVRSVPNALLVVSIPASDIEVGGEGGREALLRLKNVIGRMESAWRPASAEEGFEIVRRRLFETISGDEAHRQRDAVIDAFAKLYRAEAGEFPSGVGEARYRARMASSYPLHPALFDCLYEDWSTLETFQRTRGVLRLMAKVIHELWERQDAGLLIMPAGVPLDSADVRSELTQYLEPGWEPVVASDVDGPNSVPLQLDRDNPALMRYSATRRVARTIYLGSAPTHGAANRGIDDLSIKLGCVQPGESPATFGDALRRLSGAATYLYVDGQRYWYSTQQSVTRLAQDRAASHFTEDDVDGEIRRRLRADRQQGDFARVHWAASGPSDVPDEPETRLVVLGPEHEHTPKTEGSPARTAAAEIMAARAGGDRLYSNMLVFLAADRTRLVELRQAVRQWLAWRSIHEEQDALNLDAFQRKLAQTKITEGDETVVQRIPETWQWLLVPGQPDPKAKVAWEESRVSGGDPLAVRASRKLVSDEALILRYAGARLRMDLDRVPLWRGDHVGVRQLWDDYAKYTYLPRLRDVTVLCEAAQDGVGSLAWTTDGFAYADAWDEEGARYMGLAAGRHTPVSIDRACVLVRPEVAQKQMGDELRAEPHGATAVAAGDAAPPAGAPDVPSAPKPTAAPTRFYGRTTVESVRLVRDVGSIAEAIVQHLGRADGAKVEVTIEINAEADEGFPDDVRRTVSENARTLKFETHEFEE